VVRANATLLEENITELALKWDVSIHVSSRLWRKRERVVLRYAFASSSA
jgi:hypothetical protein